MKGGVKFLAIFIQTQFSFFDRLAAELNGPFSKISPGITDGASRASRAAHREVRLPVSCHLDHGVRYLIDIAGPHDESFDAVSNQRSGSALMGSDDRQSA